VRAYQSEILHKLGHTLTRMLVRKNCVLTLPQLHVSQSGSTYEHTKSFVCSVAVISAKFSFHATYGKWCNLIKKFLETSISASVWYKTSSATDLIFCKHIWLHNCGFTGWLRQLTTLATNSTSSNPYSPPFPFPNNLQSEVPHPFGHQRAVQLHHQHIRTAQSEP
jgi:hypothetical protein